MKSESVNHSQIDPEKIQSEYEKLSDTKKIIGTAKWSLFIVFGAFILWASLVPLDAGVPTMAKVVVDTKRKAVQHSTGGVLKEVHVKEGDFVKKDQVLMRLGDSKAQSELTIEENNINSIRESINSQKTSIKKISGLLESNENEIKLVREELAGIVSLVVDGYAPKIQQISLEKELNRLVSRKSELAKSREQSYQSIDELGFKMEAARERYSIAKRNLEEKVIKASVAGQVLDLKKQAVGSVIRAAEKIMDLVPKNEQLLIEARIKPHLIDRISISDEVDIRFTNFSLTPMLVVPGEIISISSDVLFEENSKAPYYLARVRVNSEGMAKLGSRKMRPGMEVGVIIKTGSRTLLTYILHPLTRRIAFSMKEE